MKKRKLLALLLAAALCLGLLPTALAVEGDQETANADWTVCVYLCGTDLESEHGAATNDLLEMIQAAPTMPSGFRLLVLTGGSTSWDPNNYGLNSDTRYIRPSTERVELFEIADAGMNRRNEEFDAWLARKGLELSNNMADKNTAISFFNYAVEETDPKHMMVVFWDHGSGATGGGCCQDSLHDDDTLSVSDLTGILSNLYEKRGEPLDLAGFDACLMSELPVACKLSDYAEYMIASEEASPDSGWDYSWLTAPELSAGTIDAPAIAKAIIDRFPDVAGEAGQARWSKATMETLALTDLSLVGRLANDFDDMMGAVRKLDASHLAALDGIASRSQASVLEPLAVDLYDFASNIVKAYTDGEWAGHCDAAGDFICKGTCGALLSAARTVTEDFGSGRSTGKTQASLDNGFTGKVVAYRGRGKNAASGGISVFYPLGNPALPRAIKKTYEAVSPNYVQWMDQRLSGGENTGRFDGLLDLVETQGVGAALDYVLNISPASALENVARVKAVVKSFNQETGKTYVLGESDIDDADWLAARFEHEFPEKWYAVNGSFVSLDSGWSMEMEDNRLYKLFRIPAFVGAGSGYNTPAWVIARVAVDRLEDLGDNSGNLDATVYGFCYANSGNSDDFNISRVTLLDEAESSFSFRPVLAGDLYDAETWDRQDVVTVTYNSQGNGFELELSLAELAGGSRQFYAAYFQITDRAGNRILSDPIPYYVAERLSDLDIKPIPPQVYEGAAIEPKVSFLFMGHEVLTEGEDYTVAWSSNVEIGTAAGVITAKHHGVPDPDDTLEVTFEICHERDRTRTYIQWLADLLPLHLPGEEFEIGSERLMDGYDDAPYEEYMDHSLLAEELKEIYELHTDPADRKLFRESGLADKMERHYAAAMDGVRTTDNGVEMFGILRLVQTLFPYHAADGHFEAGAADGAPDFSQSDDPAACRRYYEEARRDVEKENDKAVAVKSYNPFFMQRATVYEAADYMMKLLRSDPAYKDMTEAQAAKMRQEYIALFLEDSGKEEADAAALYCWMSLTMSGRDVDSSGRPPMATLKLPVPSGYDADSLRVYRVTSEGAEFMLSSCAAENGRTCVVFETDVMSPSDCWFTLFAVPKASGNQSGGGPSKPSIRPGTGTAKPDTPSAAPGGGVAGFNDVAPGAWYADAVRYVVERGLFGGVGGGNFAPEANMTRAMMWTVLARYMGVDTRTANGSWYEAARAWAIAQGISDGTMAGGDVTREQFVTMLWRLSGEPAAPNSAGFTDGGSVSGYARTAVDWAVSAGIVNGYSDGTFKPQGSATRAEVAKMLTVFCTNAEAG